MSAGQNPRRSSGRLPNRIGTAEPNRSEPERRRTAQKGIESRTAEPRAALSPKRTHPPSLQTPSCTQSKGQGWSARTWCFYKPADSRGFGCCRAPAHYLSLSLPLPLPLHIPGLWCVEQGVSKFAFVGSENAKMSCRIGSLLEGWRTSHKCFFGDRLQKWVSSGLGRASRRYGQS